MRVDIEASACLYRANLPVDEDMVRRRVRAVGSQSVIAVALTLTKSKKYLSCSPFLLGIHGNNGDAMFSRTACISQRLHTCRSLSRPKLSIRLASPNLPTRQQLRQRPQLQQSPTANCLSQNVETCIRCCRILWSNTRDREEIREGYTGAPHEGTWFSRVLFSTYGCFQPT